MGEKYIKKDEDGDEHLYKEGVLRDEDLGKLHEKGFSKDKETRNRIGENTEVDEDKSFNENYRGRGRIGNQEGTFKRDWLNKYPTFHPDKPKKGSGSSGGKSSGKRKGSGGGRGGSDSWNKFWMWFLGFISGTVILCSTIENIENNDIKSKTNEKANNVKQTEIQLTERDGIYNKAPPNFNITKNGEHVGTFSYNKNSLIYTFANLNRNEKLEDSEKSLLKKRIQKASQNKSDEKGIERIVLGLYQGLPAKEIAFYSIEDGDFSNNKAVFIPNGNYINNIKGKYTIDRQKYPGFYNILEKNNNGLVEINELNKFAEKHNNMSVIGMTGGKKKYSEKEIESLVKKFVSEYSDKGGLFSFL